MTLYQTEVYNFNISYNPDIKTTKLWVNAPVFNSSRKPIGMVGTGIELSTLINVIYENINDQTALYFFNAKGEITGARNVDLITGKIKIEDELGYFGLDILDTAFSLLPGEIQLLNVSQ
jgi:methyl-accepting chemotaxis protein